MSKINKLIQSNYQKDSLTRRKYELYALDVFRWELKDKQGNPIKGTLRSEDIERYLYERGECVFLYDENLEQYLVLGSSDSSEIDLYGRSNKKICTSRNGIYNKIIDLSEEKAINIWNNDNRIPTKLYIDDYADKMSQVEKAIEQNIFMQKFPYLIQTTKKNELTMKNLFQRVALGDPAIFVNADLKANDNISILHSQAPYVADKLNQYRFELEREILTFLGINNNFEKKERVIVDEVNSNNEFISRNVEIQFKQRQRACELINEMFDLDIQVIKVNNIVKQEDIINEYVESSAIELAKDETDVTSYEEKGSGQLFELLNMITNKAGEK